MRFFFSLLCIISFGVSATPQYAFSLYETPKYPPSFDHFDYVNPNAPKGGKLTYATLGTFDTLNPFVIQGMAASGLYLTYDTLFKESDDEPDTLYPLVATSLELFPKKKEVIFTLNPKARFSDDSPITAEDIAFSFNILKTKGRPTYRYYLENVQKIETPDSHTIRIILTKWDKTFIPILATLPILSHAFWEKRDFTKTSLTPPVSSGPYVIEKVVPGKSILYKRNPHYWAKDLNVNKGFDNFDWVQADYYRDTSVILEALKTGAVDLRLENEARRWQYSLNYPQVKKGHLKRLEFNHQLPSGMQGFVFNLRRPIFQDIHVREALALLYDLVLATTRPTEDGKSNFEKTSDDYRANQQLYVRLTNDTISPVEKIEEEPEILTTIANPRETEILNVLNSKKIKNKAEKLADLLFGKKVRKSLSFGKTQYNLFPKNIIFVDENLTDNAIVNPTNKSVIDNEHNGLIIPAKTVVLGREWMEMATSSNLLDRQQAAKKLIHEQLHILLTGENSKYIEQIREIFDEFAEKNTNEELNKYLYKWDEKRYYTDGKLNQEGLEEFLVETLTSNELANALNNIETNFNENKNKKESLFQKIMKILANILGIDIKEGSLYEKEFKLLRDIFSTPEQLEINFEEQITETQTSQTAQTAETQTTQIEKTTNEETEDLSYEDEYDDLWDSSGAADLVDKRSRIQETTNNAYTTEMQSIKEKAIADGTFMKAPNGNPTNLNERQWLQVRTKAFKDWFGDWETDAANASKVVDENGEPAIVYHASPVEGINIFNVDKDDGWGNIIKSGSFFTTDKEYAKSIIPFRNKAFNETNDTYIYEVFLNIREPLEIYEELGDPHLGYQINRLYEYADNGRFNDGIKGHDYYDAVTEKYELKRSNGIEYVVFNSNQIKSATDNVGTFSKTDNNIRHSRIRENTVPSISSYVSTFPLSEQSEIIDKIDNGEISTSCK